jgi:hypothetical protein
MGAAGLGIAPADGAVPGVTWVPPGLGAAGPVRGRVVRGPVVRGPVVRGLSAGGPDRAGRVARVPPGLTDGPDRWAGGLGAAGPD